MKREELCAGSKEGRDGGEDKPSSMFESGGSRLCVATCSGIEGSRFFRFVPAGARPDADRKSWEPRRVSSEAPGIGLEGRTRVVALRT
jgi:hypothetical protein